MNIKLNLEIPQYSQEKAYCCVPACLQQIFAFYHKKIEQAEILENLSMPKHGMSIPQAGIFTLKTGFKPLIITNNIYIFDPSWFRLTVKELLKRLIERRKYVDRYNQSVIDDFLQYFKEKGRIQFDTLSTELLVKYLEKNIPIIAELASTFLYKMRKSSTPGSFDDANRGEIEGHGVVIAGYINHTFKIIDPDVKNNPYSKDGIYWISEQDLLASIFISEGKSLLLISK
ncbi:MAG: hypothetical protein ACD_63C00118G0002 [uncultured bacterium]|nr:MAG: hypothetical protein ACD_63C00118G0002 [uncultured bacterium]